MQDRDHAKMLNELLDSVTSAGNDLAVFVEAGRFEFYGLHKIYGNGRAYMPVRK